MQWQEFFELHRKTILIVLGGLILLIGGWLYSKPTTTSPTFATATSSAKPADVKNESATRTAKVCVDVKGAVNQPGVYTLGKNARVQEAINAAGGVHADADMRQVNLAKQLQDQQVVYVPAQGEQLPGSLMTGMAADQTGPSLSAGGQDAPRINLNQASKEELCQINGIGDKKADMIIQYRQQHGPFKSVDELKNVDGFGDKTVAKLKEQVAV
ncbi:helix-hairpin-helix domain-containing protein [Limosilactobacillus mucosae]|uniref:helix-hairpin-helix domain-containing protein n=1 Tax=Limosilactobacillus mucosae TaxID=97478 RepID=UPI001DD0BF44|nr:helix-hairpin-helix domain-containing protein [Limosilactobacillus mucosae]MBN2901600.1 helix-hairpin-helix domain-containing protein [Limosilactobacillus mucosae]MDC2843929.1 helix-hairpin-helix domain-containing protein [Limosilactobacillus mucosae]